MNMDPNAQSDSKRPTNPMVARTLYLSMLLKGALINAGGQSVGRLGDVIVRLRGTDYPQVTGLVVDVRGRRMFVPVEAISDWNTDRLELANAKVDLRRFERRDGEVLLKEDVLGHRVVDLDQARLVRAYDVQLRDVDGVWEVAGLDVHPVARIRLPGHHDRHAIRDWKEVEPLTGQSSPLHRGPRAWLDKLKPAEIADVLEHASGEERVDILNQVHADPELEADVFEELEEGEQSELFAMRSDDDVADVLSRMRADDAADAIMELATERRQQILDRVPDPQRTKVMTLLGYNAASAGGLMSVDFLELAANCSVADALGAIRDATTLQPQAVTSVYVIDDHGRLSGAALVTELLQADPSSPLGAVADSDPVRVTANADIVGLTLTMADHNLLTLPVVDDQDKVIGVITVDDVLEANVPESWRRR